MTAQVSSEASHTDHLQADILAEVRNHIGHLTLNRPAGLNAITLDMVRSLSHQLQAWADDPTVYAVVLRGAGEKAFCAGGDQTAQHRDLAHAHPAQAPPWRH